MRIYPTYYAVAFFNLIIYIFFPVFLGIFGTKAAVVLPTNLNAILPVLTIFGLQGNPFTLILVGCSLDVEIRFYVLMGLLLSRGKIVSAIWFVASVAIIVYLLANGKSFEYRYYSTEAISISFATGAFIYHYGEYFRYLGVRAGLFFAAAFVVFAIYANHYDEWSKVYGLYVAVFLVSIVLAGLGTIDRGSINAHLRKTDDYLGTLAYPLFLCHYSSMFIFGHIHIESIYLKVTDSLAVRPAITFLVAMLFAVVFMKLVDDRLASIRTSIRNTRVPH